MPPLPSPGSVLRVTWKQGDAASIEAGSRVLISYDGSAPSAADLNTLATAVSTEWTSDIAGLVSTSEALHGVEILDLSSDVGNEGAWSGTVAGTRSGEPLPAQACAVINHSISRKYRGGRPRTYLRSGTAPDLATTNQWSEAFTTAALSGWEGFIAGILATTGIGITSLALVNVSFYNGNRVFTGPTGRARNIPVPRATPLLDNITESAVAPKVGTQRRRLDI